MNNNLPSADNEIETSIAKERLRQARYSFNVALIATAVSACVSLVGAALLLSGKVPEGTATVSTGVVTSAGCIVLAKDANNRLDKLTKDLMDDS